MGRDLGAFGRTRTPTCSTVGRRRGGRRRSAVTSQLPPDSKPRCQSGRSVSVGEFACERAGPVCRDPGLLGPLLVCTGVRRVADGQLVKNAGRVIFGLGEGGDRGRKTGAYLPGLPGKSLPG